MTNIYQIRFGAECKKRGFTLVETLVAISILLLVIIGPMTIAAKGMQMGFYANEQMTAVYLAQEAIESIQNLRDDNALRVVNQKPADADYDPNRKTWDWYEDINPACKIQSGDNGCDYNIADTADYITCPQPPGCLLKKSNSSHRAYDHSGSDSLYTRKIILEPVMDGIDVIAVNVTVEVSWSAHLFDDNLRKVTLQTYVYDHYQHYEP